VTFLLSTGRPAERYLTGLVSSLIVPLGPGAQIVTGDKMARVAMIIVAVALTGCSLVNPYVFPEGSQAEKFRAKTVPMDVALEYSATAKDRYREALRDQARLQSWLALGLIPLSAAAIGLGATGGSPHAVLALGLTGASAFGAGVWLSNKPRQLAYVAGIKAVTCAEDAVAPLDVSGTVRNELDTNVKALGTELPILQTATDKVAALAAAAAAEAKAVQSKKPVLAGTADALGALASAARDEVDVARSLASSAREARSSGVALQRVLDGAGRELVNAVNKIADAVDGLITETQRDPQTLTTIISGLGGAFKSFTTVPEGLKGTSPAGQAPKSRPEGDVNVKELLTPDEQTQRDALVARTKELNDALTSLRASVTTVGRARQIVADHVNSILNDTPVQKLKSCGVNAGDLVTALTVEPAQPIHVKKSAATSFTIKGGLSPYGASLVSGAAGLTVTQAAVFSPAVNVVTTKDTPAGSYVVNVSDGAGHQLSVTLIVDAGDAPATGQGAAASDDLQAFLDAMAKKPTVTVNMIPFTVKDAKLSDDKQSVLVTVEVGAVPRDAVIAGPMNADVAKTLRDKFGPKLPEAGAVRIVNTKDLEKDALEKKKVEAQGLAACKEPDLRGPVMDEPAFSSLADTERRKIQSALCLSGNAVDGRWGRITKGKLILYQCQQGRTPDGKLDAPSIKELREATETSIADRCGKH